MTKILEEKIENGVLYLGVKVARLDASAAREFKIECAAFWRPGIERLVIDLAAVDFLDSSGIGALLSLHKRLPAPNASVRLINLRPQVQTVIELLRLHRIFELQS